MKIGDDSSSESQIMFKQRKREEGQEQEALTGAGRHLVHDHDHLSCRLIWKSPVTVESKRTVLLTIGASEVGLTKAATVFSGAESRSFA